MNKLGRKKKSKFRKILTECSGAFTDNFIEYGFWIRKG
jgi:hypothetical protein